MPRIESGEIANRAMLNIIQQEDIMTLLDALPPKDLTVIETVLDIPERYPKTLHVSMEFGVTEERATQLLANIRRRARSIVDTYGLNLP